MGRSRIVIEMVSGHGCDRTAQPGEKLRPFCSSPSCVDCRVGEVVAKLDPGMFTNDGCGATHTHWPNMRSSSSENGCGEVVDDLVTRTRRHGSFK